MKWVKKYNYLKSTKSLIGGSRYYSIENTKLPSVSEILEKTKPEEEKEALKAWRAKIGEAESARISKESLSRGSKMHKIIENFLLNRLNGELLVRDDLAQKMANELLKPMNND